jgi:G:T-mismatch repair DNA endonuclease (very short patch repair protein)
MWSKPGSKHALPETAAKISTSVRKLHEDPEFTRRVTRAWVEAGHSIQGVSQVELSIKNQLNERGFKHSSERPETFVGPYVPDYVNFASREIVEVYGDYWHANPQFYEADDYLYTNQETQKPVVAKDKWSQDAIRERFYVERGWTYRVIWETDIKAGRLDSI